MVDIKDTWVKDVGKRDEEMYIDWLIGLMVFGMRYLGGWLEVLGLGFGYGVVVVVVVVQWFGFFFFRLLLRGYEIEDVSLNGENSGYVESVSRCI